MKSSKIRPITVVFMILTLLWCTVIFGFSSRSADESTQDSDGVISIITEVVKDVFGKELELDSFIVRKAGHMTEFAILGVLASATVISAIRKISFKSAAFCLLFCTVIASLDELSQFLSPGRSPQVTDVAIDSVGAFIGIMFSSLVCILHTRGRGKISDRSE